eukprot:NODE_11675_length_1271_cov_12.799825.p1 GENE.NODE_11675_length_1271_cov_12.799825~~NODE_11675_length_1271_cov_12.799825.p1  ORF type:complete len:397 (+),score=89.49 NODE_11675_length_1271_cov_12.799825:169-1191(+)
MAKECLKVARDAGINLFDNAETYGTSVGLAEEIMGEAIAALRAEDPDKWRRSDILITTKIFWGGNGVNECGLSVKHIREGLSASLKRLREDYVDLVFCHRPDPFTPTETVVRAMTDAVRTGKACSWGTSEWSAHQITEAYWIAKTLGLEPPAFEQPQYNMFHREHFEKELYPLYQHPYNIATTTWSPLASGLLTGKYLDGIPPGSRVDTKNYEFVKVKLEKWQQDGTMEKVRQLACYAKTLDCSLGQLALAWSIRNANATTTILGATKPEQLRENLGALAVAERMTAKEDAAVEAILDNKPEDYNGWGGAGQRRVMRMESTETPPRVANFLLPPAKKTKT